MCLNKQKPKSQLKTEPKVFPKLAVANKPRELKLFVDSKAAKVNSLEVGINVAAKKDKKKAIDKLSFIFKS